MLLRLDGDVISNDLYERGQGQLGQEPRTALTTYTLSKNYQTFLLLISSVPFLPKCMTKISSCT